MSRQRHSSRNSLANNSSSAGDSLAPADQQGDGSEQPSSSSPNRMSLGSEGYPSWLPKRPPPPAPGSTFQSSYGQHGEAGPSEPFVGGRKPTPRSVRIVSLQSEKDPYTRREPTDQTRVSNPMHARVWSRATGAGMSPTLFSAGGFSSRIPQPKFRSTGLHLELLRNPTLKSRLYFYLLPIIVFAHIPLQTFFDFNAVFVLLQVAKFPSDAAPGVPGSGKNWALGAAAYVACWLTWIFVVFIVYELIYSYSRRWRIKRPLVIPIYFSAPAFNLVSMTSYSNFCFLQHIRYAAFFGENGSLRDGLAETFWYYSQNIPTVALLLPRAGLALALLLSFSSPQPRVLALADAGVSHRDGTFFRTNGTLTGYARGVLIANAAWTAWRVLVLLCSWMGLWILSGQGCAGLCGPRYRWDEDDAEKTMSFYSDAGSEVDALPWSWRECTRIRIQEAYDFCSTIKPPRWSGVEKKEAPDASELLGPAPRVSIAPFEGMEQVMAAVGFPSTPPPARRGMLSEDLFTRPKDELVVPKRRTTPELSDIIPKIVRQSSRDHEVAGPSAPLMTLPYPFIGHGAQRSSDDQVPFPPSPVPGGEKGKGSSGSEEEDDDDEDEDEDDDDDEEEVEADDEVEVSEDPSSGRASGSMSSLGQPVTSRYPFQFRRPARGASLSSGAASHISPHSNDSPSNNSWSTPSYSTQSTGNRESTDSQSPRSGGIPSPTSYSGGIPMPPRHPRGRGRARAGPLPSAVPSSPTSIVFPRARTRQRESFGSPEPASVYESNMEEEDDEGEEMPEQPEPEGPHEAAEKDDIVGLLSPSAAPSPKTSLIGVRHRTSALSSYHRRSQGSRSGSNSRSDSQSGSSSSQSRRGSISLARSRAQSLIQSIGAASRSSLDLVPTSMRSRANSSMARLEEDATYLSDGRTHSRSGSGSDAVLSSPENYTFGHPLRAQWRQEDERLEEEPEPRSEPPSPLHGSASRSNLSVSAKSEHPSERTVSRLPEQSLEPIQEPVGVSIPGGGDRDVNPSATGSHPDISTAAQSFVTAPATIEGMTDSSGRTVSSWGGTSHMVQRPGEAWGPA